ncbi:unnamed protein product [Symbiodinium natans]|uniref:Uncharacterized protein n=1 Tax=Symbiodinium natans TaxID=878477 RepID=A0A812I658_9DINO|nr:unnamed protein product [Symbiodinium natans]
MLVLYFRAILGAIQSASAGGDTSPEVGAFSAAWRYWGGTQQGSIKVAQRRRCRRQLASSFRRDRWTAPQSRSQFSRILSDHLWQSEAYRENNFLAFRSSGCSSTSTAALTTAPQLLATFTDLGQHRQHSLALPLHAVSRPYLPIDWNPAVPCSVAVRLAVHSFAKVQQCPLQQAPFTQAQMPKAQLRPAC